jgi:hypothetical protein
VKRILIAISGAVLAAGVEGVLTRTGGFEVTRVPSDENAIRREVDRLNPAALIVDHHVGAGELAFALEKTNSRAGLIVLVVHPETNALQVYHRRHVELQSSTDLVELLQAS